MADSQIPRADVALGPEPSQPQLQAGVRAALAVKDDPKLPSFTQNPEPYVAAIFRAMTAPHLMPETPAKKPRRKP